VEVLAMRPMIVVAALFVLVHGQPSHGQATLEPLRFTLTSLEFYTINTQGGPTYDLFPPPASVALNYGAGGTAQLDVGLVGDSALQITMSGTTIRLGPMNGELRCTGYFDVPQVVTNQTAFPTTTVGMRGVNLFASATGDAGASMSFGILGQESSMLGGLLSVDTPSSFGVILLSTNVDPAGVGRGRYSEAIPAGDRWTFACASDNAGRGEAYFQADQKNGTFNLQLTAELFYVPEPSANLMLPSGIGTLMMLSKLRR
jgi:hypothetical protein